MSKSKRNNEALKELTSGFEVTEYLLVYRNKEGKVYGASNLRPRDWIKIMDELKTNLLS